MASGNRGGRGGIEKQRGKNRIMAAGAMACGADLKQRMKWRGVKRRETFCMVTEHMAKSIEGSLNSGRRCTPQEAEASKGSVHRGI